MRLSTLSIPTILSLASIAKADQAADINFVTAFVGDLKNNQPQYLSYIATASAVPNDLLSLYGEVRTYTDDSYTTLIGSVNVPEIESFAYALPWASRISSEVGAGATHAP